MPLQIVSQSAGDTQTRGQELGQLLDAGDIVCLYGELGSGKTVLSKGIARGLGVSHERAVRSPSFVLIHRYQGRVAIYHADLYRLEGPTDLADIGLRDLLGGDGVAVIEWADKLEASLPSERLDITLAHQTEDTRLITISPQGVRYGQLVARWQSCLASRTEASSRHDDAAEKASV
jgi:tRNA threonylcarbamoyladenosine biosynthesis protein TsaE